MSQDQYFQLLAELNLSLWPWQVLIQVMGLAAIAVGLRCPRGAPKAGPLFLGLASLGVAVLWYGVQLSRLDALAWLGLVLHALLTGVLFAAARKGDLAFGWRFDVAHGAGALLLAYALIGYPIVAFQADHSYPFSALFGVAPAPTAFYLWGFLLLSVKTPPRAVIFALLAATVSHGLWVVQLDIHEDFALFPIAFFASAWLLRHRGSQATH